MELRALLRSRLGVTLSAGAFALATFVTVAPAGAEAGMEGGSADSSCTPGLVEGTHAPIWAHFQKAHLERSPLDQVSDLQSADDYALIHTVWIGDWSAPLRYGLVKIAGGTPTPILAHFQKAHLERSPTQQAADAQAANDYAHLHTVWLQSILTPSQEVIGGSGC